MGVYTLWEIFLRNYDGTQGEKSTGCFEEEVMFMFLEFVRAFKQWVGHNMNLATYI